MNRIKTCLAKLLMLAAMLGLLAACAPATARPLAPTSPPSPAPSATSSEPDRDRYVADLQFIARAPRDSGSKHHDSVRDLCGQRLAELGFTVERQAYGTGVNVIGTIPGTTRSEEMVLVSAHYDTIAGSNGADDNASGVAAVLETARVLAGGKHARTLVAACWDEEEKKMVGSQAFANRAKTSGAKIVAAFVYDMVGYKSDDPNSQMIPSTMATAYPEQASRVRADGSRGTFVILSFDREARGLALDAAGEIEKGGLAAFVLEFDRDNYPSEVAFGDSAAFLDNGYSAIGIGDTGQYRYPYAHSPQDTVDKLDPGFTLRIISGVVASLRHALAGP